MTPPPLVAVLPDEPELGLQRFCKRCDEWWPVDAEFWYGLSTRIVLCAACHQEGIRVRFERRMADAGERSLRRQREQVYDRRRRARGRL